MAGQVDGQIPSVPIFERLMRMLKAWERDRGSVPAYPRRQPPAGQPTILIKSDVSEEIPAFGCMAVTGIEASDDRVIVTVAKPSTTFRWSYLFNGPRPIESLGRMAIPDRPHVLGLYNSGTPAIGDVYGPTPGQWYLTKNYPGVLSIFGVRDATNKHAFGRHTEIDTIIGKLAGSLSQGSTATVNVWGGTGGSEAVIASLTLTGRDWLMKSGATAIASGKKVIVERINGVIYVSEAECA